jgi:hypothetical protein
MVLSLKAWKSRSLPGLPRTEHPHHDISEQKPRGFAAGLFCFAVIVSPSRRPADSRSKNGDASLARIAGIQLDMELQE